MKASRHIKDEIKSDEGFSAKPYQCPGGIWTNGYGHTKGVTKDTRVITIDEAERLFERDIVEFEKIVNDNVRVELNQNQFDALVSFVYNVGPGVKGVKDGFVRLKSGKPSTLLRLINAGEFEAASRQFMLWNKSRGKVLAGLTRRRQAEAALFREPVDDAELDAPIARTIDSPEKSLAKSRTMAGASVATAGITVTALAEVTQETSKQIEPLIPYADSLKLVFLVLALLGIGLTVYARWDDRKKGLR